MTSSSPETRRDNSSFRDNRGFVFWEDGVVYRQINPSGQAAYEQLMSSGLYDALTARGWLVQHGLVEDRPLPAGASAVIRPELIDVITYPYEWSFSQLKDAAFLTLGIQKLALEHGMTLRDASAYNIQWVDGKPRLIDTLSFDLYMAGEPWVAYRQFCQHFLAPLMLMSRVDLGLSQLLRVHIDGIPLGLAARLLPLRMRLNLGLATHISLHAKFQQEHQSTTHKPAATMGTTALRGLVDSLERTVRTLKLPRTQTEWGDYYDNTNYSDVSFKAKEQIVAEFLKDRRPSLVLDLGSNDGSFSRLALAVGARVLSSDIDPLAVESNYRHMKRAGETKLLPLLVDLTNPSPGLGWANRERAPFAERAQADLAMALALIHHLAITGNVPLEMVAQYFASLAPELIIEFVPKEDSQVKRLLATREDIFADYTAEGFEAAFGRVFEIVNQRRVEGSTRILYLMRRRPREV